MKYSYESQKKALDYLIKSCPHEIDKFKSLYAVETEYNKKAKMDFTSILLSDVWNAREKVALIKLYGYAETDKFGYMDYKQDELGDKMGIEGFPMIDGCIVNSNYTGVQALLELNDHVDILLFLV